MVVYEKVQTNQMPTKSEIDDVQTIFSEEDLLMMYLGASESEQNLADLLGNKSLMAEQELLLGKVKKAQIEEESKERRISEEVAETLPEEEPKASKP